jgi:hypothetical protein
MNKNTVSNPTARLAWAVACTVLLASGVSAQPSKAFYEDFESLPLGPNREERLPGLKVWTKTPPAGWVIDDSQLLGIGNAATDGVVEWAGWSFANKDWWTQTAGDQRRSDFTFGTGTVMIADPDEWDDAPHTKGFWNSFITTREIDISAYGADTLVLAFDSSWRPEARDDSGSKWPTAEDGSAINNQTGLIRLAYDAGQPTEIIRWESTQTRDDGSDNPFFKPDVTKQDRANPDEISNSNEPFLVAIKNPTGAKTLKLTFGMIEAANDWWWAIDNLAVGVPPLVTGVSGNGVSVRARVAEALGKKVDQTKPITMSIDGTPATPVTIARDGDLALLSHDKAPKVFTPGKSYDVAVTFTTVDGRVVTDGGKFIAPSYTAVTATPAVVTAVITSPGYFAVDATKGATIKLDGTAVTATSVTPFATDTATGLVVTYAIATPLPPNSPHTFEVTFRTDGNQEVVDTVNFIAADYKTVSADLATDVGTGANAGMLWSTHQLATSRENSTALAEDQLRGALGANIANLAGANSQGLFEIAYINFEQDAAAAGIFRAGAEAELDVADDLIPGIPGTLPDGSTSTDNIAGQAIAFLEFSTPGIYTMVVRSDDGFQVSVGTAEIPNYQVLGGFDGGRGDGPTEFYIAVTKAGVYRFRLVFYEGGGGASVEWYTINPNGTKALVGGTQTGALKAYRTRTVAEPKLSLIPVTITGQPTSVEVVEGNTAAFSVLTTGDLPIAYQWLRNGTPIVGATKSTLLVGKAALANSGAYSVVVSNAGATNTSNPAYLTVVARSRSKVLLSENFTGLALGPNKEEGITTGSGGLKDAVFTKTPPTGWSVDNTGTLGLDNPDTDGVYEWAGWGFADRAWWASTAGDQTRTRFTKGQGAIAIADGDEWDDLPRTKPGSLNTLLATPPINLTGMAANSVLLKFDSSWRPEAPQKGLVTVQFDNQAPVEVLRWTGDSADATFHPDAQNETVSIFIPNPAGAKSMTVRFGYVDAGNNWWWALDNIEVSADPIGYDSLRDGLVAYLPFEDTLNDASGSGINGSAKGTPSFVAGKVGKAVNVRTTQAGEFSYVSLGKQLPLGTAQNFSVSFWARINSHTGDPAFIGNKNWNSGGNVGFVVATGGDSRIQWNLNTEGGSRKDFDSAGGVFANSAWKHVVLTVDRAGNAETWVDGAKLDSRPINANSGQSLDANPALDLNIGQDGTGTYTDGGSVFHNVDMDEVALWGRILSDSEIVTAYTRGNAGSGLLPAPAGPEIQVSGAPPNGLNGTPLQNIVVDTANRVITADIPVGSERGFLTITPAQTIQKIEINGGKLVIRY